MTASAPAPKLFSVFLLLLLPALAYLSVAWWWLHAGIHPVTGDEPHYLLIADSLREDADVRLENDYAARRYGLPPDGDGHARRLEGGWYGVHHVGLPLLLTAPQTAGRGLRPLLQILLGRPLSADAAGIVGVRFALAVFLGLAAWPVFSIFRRVLEEPRLALRAALAFLLAQPFLAGANQIYPDLPAGVLLLAAFELLSRKIQDQHGNTEARRRDNGDSLRVPASQWRSTMLAGLALAFLPWLHLKFLAPALILAAAWFFSRPPRPGLIAVALSFAGLVAYNFATAGDPWRGPFTADVSATPRQAVMIFLGLLFDRAHGLFFQNPLLWPAWFGLVPFARREPRAAALWLLVQLAVLVPNSLHPCWYGGWSFAGRFGWTTALLWAYPLAHALRLLCDRGARMLLALWCAASLLLQLLLVPAWLPAGHADSLYNPGVSGNALCHGFFPPPLARFLPAFNDFSKYPENPLNWLCVGAALFMIFAGARLEKRVRR